MSRPFKVGDVVRLKPGEDPSVAHPGGVVLRTDAGGVYYKPCLYFDEAGRFPGDGWPASRYELVARELTKAERLAERRALLAEAEATLKMWQERTAALKAEILAEIEVEVGQTWRTRSKRTVWTVKAIVGVKIWLHDPVSSIDSVATLQYVKSTLELIV